MADPDVGVTLDQLRGKEGAMVLEQVLLVYTSITHTHTLKHVYTHTIYIHIYIYSNIQMFVSMQGPLMRHGTSFIYSVTKKKIIYILKYIYIHI
jgi:hypothetical protein